LARFWGEGKLNRAVPNGAMPKHKKQGWGRQETPVVGNKKEKRGG